MNDDTPGGLLTFTVAGDDLDRLIAIEVINQLAAAAFAGHGQPGGAAAIAAMASTAAALTAAPSYAEITSAVLNAAAAHTVLTLGADPRGLLDALIAVDDAIAVRFCTDVKDLAVADWITARAATEARGLLTIHGAHQPT